MYHLFEEFNGGLKILPLEETLIAKTSKEFSRNRWKTARKSIDIK